MYLDYYLLGIILIPGLLLSIFAQIKITSNFRKYSQVASSSDKTASETAREYLNNAGLTDINIVRVSGSLTDYYNHRTKTLALSEDVYDSKSVAAIGVACHEVGHALQYKENYLPIKIRNFLIPVLNYGNKFMWALLLLGLIFYYLSFGLTFVYIGIGLFALSVLLNLVTLPVELNASNRAVQLIEKDYSYNKDSIELEGVKKVLNSAALTYLAALVISVLNLLRLVMVLLRNRSND